MSTKTTTQTPDADDTAQQAKARSANRDNEAQPIMGQHGREIQAYGTRIRMPIALDEKVRTQSIEALNQILSDTMTLRDMYKKHHWQVAGRTFYQLHLLYDKHYEEQSTLVDAIAERIQMLGGISIAMAHDVAEMTHIPRPPRGREEVPVQASRLLEAHEILLKQAREVAQKTADNTDFGTNDLLSSKIIPTNEMQAWFLSEHLVDTPLVRAE